MSRPKKVIKDSDIIEIFAIRDKLLSEATTEEAKETIHMACKGIFKCPKSATAAEKTKCFTNIRKKLDALSGKKKKTGGKKRSKSRSRQRSKK